MGRRRIFQVEQVHVIGRGIDLAGEKVGVGRNLDAILRQPFPHFRLLAIMARTRALGLPSLPPQAPQSNADSNGLFSEVLPWAQNRTSRAKLFRQSHHAQGRVYREYLLLEGEAGPRDPFLLSGSRALIDLVALPQDSDEMWSGLPTRALLCRCRGQRRFRVTLSAQGPLPQGLDQLRRDPGAAQAGSLLQRLPHGRLLLCR